MNTKFLSIPFLALLAIVLYSSAQSSQTKIDESKQKRMEEILKNLPDSVFVNVKTEDLLNDEVYMKLAHDGWTPREIMTIMETAVKDKKKAKEKFGYGYYAKQWRPTYGRSLGDDPLYQFVDTTLSAKAIESIIEAVGTQKDVRPWLVASDALVFPSYREGFPNVVIEAGAMRLPSIVTDINGSREIIINGQNGIIIPPRDEESLYQAMCRFVENLNTIKYMSLNARELIAQRYEQSFVRTCLKKYYSEILRSEY